MLRLRWILTFCNSFLTFRRFKKPSGILQKASRECVGDVCFCSHSALTTIYHHLREHLNIRVQIRYPGPPGFVVRSNNWRWFAEWRAECFPVLVITVAIIPARFWLRRRQGRKSSRGLRQAGENVPRLSVRRSIGPSRIILSQEWIGWKNNKGVAN